MCCYKRCSVVEQPPAQRYPHAGLQLHPALLANAMHESRMQWRGAERRPAHCTAALHSLHRGSGHSSDSQPHGYTPHSRAHADHHVMRIAFSRLHRAHRRGTSTLRSALSVHKHERTTSPKVQGWNWKVNGQRSSRHVPCGLCGHMAGHLSASAWTAWALIHSWLPRS